MQPSENLFRYFGGTRTRLRSGQEIFCNRITDVVSLVDNSTALAAGLCREFATLAEHADRIAARPDLGTRSAENWKSLLAQAAGSGLLMSMSALRERTLANLRCLPSPRVIDRVVVPTRNRPQLLKRLLMSVAQNLREFGREAEVVIADDSDSAEMQAANRDVISALAGHPSIEVRYGNSDSRRRFAARLAAESDVSEDVISFALANDDGYPFAAGVSRNGLLLDSSGHCLLYVDDDVQFRAATVPDSREDVILRSEPFATWFLNSAEEIESCRFTPVDFLGLHESLLNFDQTALRNGGWDSRRVDLSTVSIGLLRRIEQGSAGVLISVMGIVGDSGFDDPLAYFILGDETLSRLTKDRQSYERALVNLLVLHAPRRSGVCDQCECHSYCMGVDNTEMLPPFMPVMRSEELVFGALVRKCIPGGLFGFTPRAILHQPGEARQFARDAALSRAGRFALGETLAFLVGGEVIKGASRRELIVSLGTRLKEASRQKDRDLHAQIQSSMQPMLLLWVQQLDEAIGRCPRASQFWVSDALKIKAAILSRLKERNHLIPFDLEQIYGPEEGQRRFRRLIGQFASLLKAWPDLVEATKTLQSKGESSYRRVLSPGKYECMKGA